MIIGLLLSIAAGTGQTEPVANGRFAVAQQSGFVPAGAVLDLASAGQEAPLHADARIRNATVLYSSGSGATTDWLKQLSDRDLEAMFGATVTEEASGVRRLILRSEQRAKERADARAAWVTYLRRHFLGWGEQPQVDPLLAYLRRVLERIGPEALVALGRLPVLYASHPAPGEHALDRESVRELQQGLFRQPDVSSADPEETAPVAEVVLLIQLSDYRLLAALSAYDRNGERAGFATERLALLSDRPQRGNDGSLVTVPQEVAVLEATDPVPQQAFLADPKNRVKAEEALRRSPIGHGFQAGLEALADGRPYLAFVNDSLLVFSRAYLRGDRLDIAAFEALLARCDHVVEDREDMLLVYPRWPSIAMDSQGHHPALAAWIRRVVEHGGEPDVVEMCRASMAFSREGRLNVLWMRVEDRFADLGYRVPMMLSYGSSRVVGAMPRRAWDGLRTQGAVPVASLDAGLRRIAWEWLATLPGQAGEFGPMFPPARRSGPRIFGSLHEADVVSVRPADELLLIDTSEDTAAQRGSLSGEWTARTLAGQGERLADVAHILGVGWRTMDDVPGTWRLVRRPGFVFGISRPGVEARFQEAFPGAGPDETLWTGRLSDLPDEHLETVREAFERKAAENRAFPPRRAVPP